MQEADHILIPLLDGTACLGQVFHCDGARALILLTTTRATKTSKPAAIAADDVMGAVVVDLALLSKEQWAIIGYDAIPKLVNLRRWDLSADDHLHDPAIVEAFCNALVGLYPWDGFPEPDFFTYMLLPHQRDPLPARARKTAEFPTPDASNDGDA